MLNVGIYCIENIVTGDGYIGQSGNLHKRKIRHKSSLKNKKYQNHHLQYAWDKYGEESFIFKVLIYCEKEELTYYEQKCVDYLNSQYNIRRICVESGKGVTFSNETKSKISKAGKGKIRSQETRKRMSEASKGRIVSKETREKLSQANKGRIVSEETKIKISNANKGKVRSEEMKLKTGELSKGRIVSEETRLKISKSNKGRICSEEVKKNMAKAQKGKLISDETRLKISKSKTGSKLNKSTSKYHGVVFVKKRNTWRFNVLLNKKQVSSKDYKIEIEAALAFDKYVVEHNLPNPLNFPNEI